MAEDPEWLQPLIPREVVYSVPGMERAVIAADVVYRATPDEALTMDVYRPPERGAHPLILFVHGGPIPPNLATKPKDWSVYRSYGRLAAASGFVGVTFNHRYDSYEALPIAQEDIHHAIAHLREHAGEFQADANCTVLWAFSGGGAFLAEPIKAPQPFMRALIGFYCVLDFTGAPGLSESIVRDYSAAIQLQDVPKPTIPMFIARAGRDSESMLQGTDRFVTVANARNAPLTYMNHPEGRHGFDILDDDATTRWIIGEALAFAKNCTRNAES